MKREVKRKSASMWDRSSERALLEVWQEKMDQLRGCRKNGHILLEMVQELQAQGFNYSVVELKTKMHNITARYRREKQKISSTGDSPSEWKLFKEVDMLLAPYNSYYPQGLVVDSISNINSSIKTQQCSLNSNSPPSSPPMPSSSLSPSMASDIPSSLAAEKKNVNIETFLKSVEKNIENIHNYIKRTSTMVLQIEEEKKEILKSYVDREAEVQKALVEFLKRA